jgi:transketolase N-terminal domain/subunit
LLQFVEDGGVDGALEAAEEVFELPVRHTRRGEVVGVGGATGIRVHALERRVFAFFGDGERVRHYECHDD